MQFPSNFNLKPANVLKMAGLTLVVIILISLAFRLIGSSISSINVGQSPLAYKESYSKDYGQTDSSVGLSVRNVTPPVPATDSDLISGENAEDFEVTEYNIYIETRRLEETCSQVMDLKSRPDVIFETANEYEKNCNYRFKVRKENTEEIMAIINELKPKEFNESTYTIKRLVDDYTSELEILEKKMNSINETLTNATAAYDDIAGIATRIQDAESLAKIIDSKINIIEKLTQERINITAQLERLGRAKAEQLDRLNYTYFNVYITENKFVDWQDLKESWQLAVKSFVRNVNEVIQDITINLVGLLFQIFQYVVYLFIILIVAKYGWRLAKRIWTK